MPYDPRKHHRRSIRLPGYDYAQPGAYFVTICTHRRACLFGRVVDGEMRLNDAGRIVQASWDDLPNHYPHVQLDAFVVMPNHVHGIIILTDDVVAIGAGLRPAPIRPAPITQPTTKRHPLSEIVRAFKSFSSRRINQLRGTPGTRTWQRNYYEHIVRNEGDLHRIRAYIANNPAKWFNDRHYRQ